MTHSRKTERRKRLKQTNNRKSTANTADKTQLHATESYITAVASANTLNLTYPLGTAKSIFTLKVAANPYPFTAAGPKDVTSWSDLLGLDVKVSGNINETFSLGYAGSYGGPYTTIK